MLERRLLTASQAARYLGRSPRQFQKIQDQVPLAQPRQKGENGRLGWRYYWQHDLDRWMDKAKKLANEKSEPSSTNGVPIDPADCPEWD